MNETTPETPKQRRSIYLLPNAITTCAVFAGFYAIVAAMKGYFDIAAIAIFIAMLADTLDGRVARITNTQSEFGAQYDSLSDMIAFGAAPALVAYNWALAPLGKVGWLAAFVFTATTAMRLARFNLQRSDDVVDNRFFIGLPCPAAAAVIAGLVWVGHQIGVAGEQIALWVAIITVLMGVLMFSNFHYYSFKKMDLRGKVPFVSLLALILVIVGIAFDPPKILFAVFFLYALSGPVYWLIKKTDLHRWLQRLKANKQR